MLFSWLVDLMAEESRAVRPVEPMHCGKASRRPRTLSLVGTIGHCQAIGALAQGFYSLSYPSAIKTNNRLYHNRSSVIDYSNTLILTEIAIIIEKNSQKIGNRSWKYLAQVSTLIVICSYNTRSLPLKREEGGFSFKFSGGQPSFLVIRQLSDPSLHFSSNYL